VFLFRYKNWSPWLLKIHSVLCLPIQTISPQHVSLHRRGKIQIN
jgi:hypothetical protein